MDAMLKILLVILQFIVIAVCSKTKTKCLVLSSSNFIESRVKFFIKLILI